MDETKYLKTDMEILEELKEKASHRDLGINSINYYYVLKHVLEALNDRESQQSKTAE